jgi:hypothetical protein
MTISVNPSLRAAFIYQVFWEWVNFNAYVNKFACTVFPGVQPRANDILANWTNYNTTSLWTCERITWNNVSMTDENLHHIQAQANGAVAHASGVGTWAIIWPNTNDAVTHAKVIGATIPSKIFIVIPVSTTGGSGMLRFKDTTFTNGARNDYVDLTIRVGVA